MKKILLYRSALLMNNNNMDKDNTFLSNYAIMWKILSL